MVLASIWLNLNPTFLGSGLRGERVPDSMSPYESGTQESFIGLFLLLLAASFVYQERLSDIPGGYDALHGF